MKDFAIPQEMWKPLCGKENSNVREVTIQTDSLYATFISDNSMKKDTFQWLLQKKLGMHKLDLGNCPKEAIISGMGQRCHLI